VHNTRKVMDTIVQAVATVLLGKEDQIRLALACLLARGHLLIEDLPGMGKTTLAQGLARALGLSFSRIQFTSDLLPADILGISVYERNSGEFRFHPGPVFSQLLLADEINRTTPKTQSALLEAMAEGQATVEGETRPLPRPFFVIATQNPVTQAGTFPLPESQQDRFTACLSLGYPDPAAERRLLEGGDPRRLLDRISPCLSAEQLQHFQHAVSRITASEAIIDYLQRLIQYTRTQGEFEHGLSPRAGLALLQCARAWAMIAGRHYVVPEDVQAVFPAVAGHRLQGAGVTATGEGRVEQVLNAVDVL
jgi:MoxR-like ATPase